MLKFDEHRAKGGPMMAEYGGRYLTKPIPYMPEGGHWVPERDVVIEFPNLDAINAWYHYRELLERPDAAGQEISFASKRCDLQPSLGTGSALSSCSALEVITPNSSSGILIM
jgi:uncharacterized protein (DUF1330 family)